MTIEKNNRLNELDALRGLAAIGVCLFHFNLFKYGCTGVDLFFMISGFVIFMSIKRSSNIKDFWFSRIIRLYPSYWLSILLAISFIRFFNSPSLPANFKFIVGNITMFQPILHTSNIIGVYWTLYVEMLFYILMSFLWLTTKFRNIETTLIIGLFIAFGINSIYLITGSYYPTYQKFFIITRSIFPLISHFQSFSAGIIFYLFYTNGINNKGILILLFTIICTAIAHRDSVMINNFITVLEHIVCIFVFYLVFILIIKSKLNILKAKLFTILGATSYPLYLIHQLFSNYFINFMSPHIGDIMSTVFSLLLAMLLSLVVTYWYDIPLRKQLNKMVINNAAIASQQGNSSLTTEQHQTS